ncbi:MAG: methyltransferase domain-containing protein [Acidobacteria bacterium]|nr:methyltransferase domain-containing protein [Acidobacteriota bacterium]
MPDLFPDFSRRSTEAEIMDGDDYTLEEIGSAYANLRKVNKYLGGTSALLRHLVPLMEASGSRRVTILDVGAGSADIPQAIVCVARQKGIDIQMVAVDASPHAIATASENIRGFPEIHLVQAQALQVPFADNSFDFVIASELLHHLTVETGAAFLRLLNRIGRVAFLINDLRRHPIPYYSFWVLSHLFTTNRISRNDGLVSILRGFTPEDLRELQRRSGLTDLSVHFRFPYRVVIVGSATKAPRHEA